MAVETVIHDNQVVNLTVRLSFYAQAILMSPINNTITILDDCGIKIGRSGLPEAGSGFIHAINSKAAKKQKQAEQ